MKEEGVGIPERSCSWQPVGERDSDVIQSDVGILNDANSCLVGNGFSAETLGTFLDDEPFNLIVCCIAGPDQDVIREGTVADPSFVPIQNPFISASGCSGFHLPGNVGPVQGLGEGEGSYFLERQQVWKHGLTMLIGAQFADRCGEQFVMDAKERGHGGIRACEFHLNQSGQ
ncbi:hypothetical protein ABIE00_000174 [Arthrobacter sp. OAP107]